MCDFTEDSMKMMSSLSKAIQRPELVMLESPKPSPKHAFPPSLATWRFQKGQNSFASVFYSVFVPVTFKSSGPYIQQLQQIQDE